MILISGATGSIGRHLVHQLGTEAMGDTETVALVRDPSKGEALGGRYAVADFDDPDALGHALRGVDRVFLTGPGAEPAEGEQPMIRRQCAFIDQAAAAGVRYVVKVSARHARPGARLAEGAHWRVEEHLRCSGMDWTVLRPGGFMQNFLTGAGFFMDDDVILGAYGDTRLAYVDTRDIALCAAELLREPRPRHTFELSGPTAQTQTELAAKLSRAVGRVISYADRPSHEFAERLTALGVPTSFANEVAALFGECVDEEPTTTVTDLTGQRPRSFDDFLHDHTPELRAAWNPRR